MPDRDVFLLYIRRFEHAAIPYMVTGSVAAMAYKVSAGEVDVGVVARLATERGVASEWESVHST